MFCVFSCVLLFDIDVCLLVFLQCFCSFKCFCRCLNCCINVLILFNVFVAIVIYFICCIDSLTFCNHFCCALLIVKALYDCFIDRLRCFLHVIVFNNALMCFNVCKCFKTLSLIFLVLSLMCIDIFIRVLD